MRMDFKEFFRLNESRHYYAYQARDGRYHVSSVFFTDPNERNQEAKSVQRMDKPAKMWYFTINPGDHTLNIPNANPAEKEQIGLAYYHRMFAPADMHSRNYGDVEGDVIEPQTFDKHYYQKIRQQDTAKQAQDPTVNYTTPQPAGR